jgi:hypothetical protein
MAGECRDAWRELTGYSEWIKLPEYLGDAEKIAAETMARVHRNLNRLTARLRKMGYRFGELPGGKRPAAARNPVRSLPDAQAVARLQTLLATTSPMPLSLQYLLTTVGGVNLCGHHPRWPEPAALDPLFLPALDDAFLAAWQNAYSRWRQAHPRLTPQTPQLEITLSPSARNKSGRRGGNPSVMRVGLLIMDDIYINDYRPMSFIGYLRETFRCGGFPGLAHDAADHTELMGKLTEGSEIF